MTGIARGSRQKTNPFRAASDETAVCTERGATDETISTTYSPTEESGLYAFTDDAASIYAYSGSGSNDYGQVVGNTTTGWGGDYTYGGGGTYQYSYDDAGMTGLLGGVGAYRETEDTSDFYDYDITGYYDLSFVSGANTRSQSDDWHEAATNDWTGSYDESGGYGPGGDEGVYDSHYTYDYTLAYDGSGTADAHAVYATGFANSHGHYAYDGSREDGWVETDAGSFEDDVDSGFYQSNESFSGGGTFDTDGNSNSQYSAGGITTTTNGSYDSHEVWSDDSTSVYKELYLDGVTLLSESISTGTADDNTTGHSTGHSTYTTLSSSSSTDTTSDSTYTVHWQWNETSRFGLGGTSNTADNSTTESRSSTYSMTYSCDGRWSTSGGTITYSNSTPTVWTHSMGTPPTGTPTTPSYNGPTSSRWDDLIAELLSQAANAYNTPANRAAAVDAALAAFADVDEDENGQNGGILLDEFSDPPPNSGGSGSGWISGDGYVRRRGHWEQGTETSCITGKETKYRKWVADPPNPIYEAPVPADAEAPSAPVPSGRRIVIWFGHVAIEVYDPELGETIFLEFNPRGFVENFPYWGAIPATDWIPSTPEQDAELIRLWSDLEQKRQNGEIMSWNPIFNCWVPVVEFFGAGLTYPPTSFPPGWNPSDHACMNCHAPEVKAWMRATPQQRQNWSWPPKQ